MIDLDYEIRGICAIEKKNCLIAASSKHHCLILFDKNFRVVQTIDHIDNKTILPRYVATNNKDKIFVVQSSLNKVTAIDFELNFINEFGSEGPACNQFDCPLGIFCYENSVYICDSLNMRIQRCSEDLVLEESYPVNFKPWEIKISNNYACVRPNGLEFIYVYSLSPFRLLKAVSEGNGAIHCSQFWFYEISLLKYFSCYDLCGRLIDKVKIDVLDDIDISDGQVSMEYFNGNLVVSCKKARKLIILG